MRCPFYLPQIFSIPNSTLFTTCKRFKIFIDIDLPKNIRTLLDTSSHSHIWKTSFCSNDHGFIQSKLKWEPQNWTWRDIVATEDKNSHLIATFIYIKHVNAGSVLSVILNVGPKAQKRPGRARLCHHSKERSDARSVNTDAPQCSLAQGGPWLPAWSPGTGSFSQWPPRCLHSCTDSVWGPSMLRIATISCVSDGWGRPQRQDPAQTRPFVALFP